MQHTYITTEVTTRQQWNDFYQVPKTVYEHCKNHTLEIRQAVEDELNSDKNPIANQSRYTAFVTYKNRLPIARCVAIFQDNLCNKMQRRIGQIGYIEFIDDPLALSNLISSASNWLTTFGIKELWTDIRFSLNYQVGITTFGFGENHTFLMPNQPEYYCDNLMKIGFKCIKNLNAYNIDLTSQYQIPPSTLEQANKLLNKGFSIRRMRLSDINLCLRHYNTRWNNNFAHTPFSEDELQHLESSMKLFLDTRFCFIAEFNGDLAGYIFTFPDYNRELQSWKGRFSVSNILKFIIQTKILKRVKGVKTAIIGVDQAYEGMKLSSLLNAEVLGAALKHRCSYMERSWILEDNIASIKQASRIGGTLYKQFSIFSMPVEGTQESTLEDSA